MRDKVTTVADSRADRLAGWFVANPSGLMCAKSLDVESDSEVSGRLHDILYAAWMTALRIRGAMPEDPFVHYLVGDAAHVDGSSKTSANRLSPRIWGTPPRTPRNDRRCS